jgi:hypothetical protein
LWAARRRGNALVPRRRATAAAANTYYDPIAGLDPVVFHLLCVLQNGTRLEETQAGPGSGCVLCGQRLFHRADGHITTDAQRELLIVKDE